MQLNIGIRVFSCAQDKFLMPLIIIIFFSKPLLMDFDPWNALNAIETGDSDIYDYFIFHAT